MSDSAADSSSGSSGEVHSPLLISTLSNSSSANIHCSRTFGPVAKWVEAYLKQLLSREGIQAIISSRAKDSERLGVKLNSRANLPETVWLDEKAMLQDLVDLAGVRIALYFPADRARVNTLIKQDEMFKTLKEKQFPEPAPSAPESASNIKAAPTFGYGATHHRIQLVAEKLPGPFKHYALAHCIEIQVASLLMHAWAEVGHDLLYKPLKGEVSDAEKIHVQLANSLVLIAEQHLHMLQEATSTRLAASDQAQVPFRDHYELATFIMKLVTKKTKDLAISFKAGDMDVLFDFLVFISENYGDSSLNAPAGLEHCVTRMLDTEDLEDFATVTVVDMLVPHLNEIIEDPNGLQWDSFYKSDEKLKKKASLRQQPRIRCSCTRTGQHKVRQADPSWFAA